MLLSNAGCRREGLTPVQVEASSAKEEPAWLFEPPGYAEFEGQTVVRAVGVGYESVDYKSRVENALKGAKRRLKEEILSTNTQMGEEIVDHLSPPEYLSRIFHEVVKDSAKHVAEKMSEEAEQISRFESMLRREVFFELAVPLDKITFYYHSVFRKKLKEKLIEKLESEEVDVYLQRFDDAILRM